MIKNLLAIQCVIIFLLCPILAKAVPAYPYPVKVTQPDGSSVMICLHGDEFMNSMSTEDGYTVVLNAAGYYVYADLKNATLVPSAYVAKDAALRTTEEQNYLFKTGKNITVAEKESQAKLLRTAANEGYIKNGILNRANAPGLENYRGLVILVEYNDCGFRRNDANALFTDMINKRNYTGYDDGNSFIEYTGSVRDYFYDNSKGRFDPEFDVVGPVKIDYSQTYVNQTQNSGLIMQAACRAADSFVDFSKYDADGDGEVDMVYFVFAGAGSNMGSNNPRYLWPHASAFRWFKLDGINLGRYACSTELYGAEDEEIMDGIGTICHEFSHVLGFPDLYDTDYEGSGGQSNHPNVWSVMSGGSYLNMTRTPCGYTLFERYVSGWVTPTLINGEGEHTLRPLATSEEGFRINSSVEKEFFLLENRQQEGWDSFLPGHGMLIFRVDSTDVSVWRNNTINNNPAHQYFEMVRAIPGATDSGTDPFPGTKKVTEIMGNGALASWNGSATPISIFDIEENNGIITFKSGSLTEETYLEDFESMSVTSGNVSNIEGKFSTWTFRQSLIEEPGSELAHGNRSVSLIKGARLTSTKAVDAEIKTASFMFWNPTKTAAEVRLQYSNKGTFWTTAKTIAGETLATVAPGKSALIKFSINAKTPTVYQITLSEGSSTEKCYLDDFTLTYVPQNGTGISHIEDGPTWNVYCKNGRAIVAADEELASEVSVYSANGVLIAREKLQNGKAEIPLPTKGMYIIHCGNKTSKVIY